MAVADRIAVDRSKQGGNQLVSLADRLTEVRQLAAKLAGIKDHTTDGATFTQTETAFGLAAGDGTKVATLLSTLNNLLNTTTAPGSATILANLDEFAGRLSGQ